MAQACVNLGRTWQEEGEWDEALPWLRRAAEIEPRSLVFLALLAEAAVERELFDEAIACYQRMLEIDPKLAATHNALGWLLQESGRLDESANHLNTTLSLRPDFAIAHVNLGGIHEKLGDFAAAETCVPRGASPTYKRALRPWRGWRMLLRGRLPDADIELIEEHLAGSDESDPSRVNLLFGLAGVLGCSQVVFAGRPDRPRGQSTGPRPACATETILSAGRARAAHLRFDPFTRSSASLPGSPGAGLEYAAARFHHRASAVGHDA